MSDTLSSSLSEWEAASSSPTGFNNWQQRHFGVSENWHADLQGTVWLVLRYSFTYTERVWQQLAMFYWVRILSNARYRPGELSTRWACMSLVRVRQQEVAPKEGNTSNLYSAQSQLSCAHSYSSHPHIQWSPSEWSCSHAVIVLSLCSHSDLAVGCQHVVLLPNRWHICTWLQFLTPVVPL